MASLRARALVATALGLAGLASMAIFDNYDEARLIAARAEVERVNQVQADNQSLLHAVGDADTTLATYVTAGSTATPGSREELLAEYLQASGDVSSSLEKLRRDTAADPTGLGRFAQPVESATAGWQTWAHAARLAAGQPGAPTATAGAALLARFQSADATFADQLRSAADLARAAQVQREADHVRVFYGGVLAEALVISLLAFAVVNGLVKPIRRLTRTAADLADGRPTRVPFIDRPDEVGSLARALAGWQQAAADLAQVFDHSPVGMARLEADGKVREANPTLRAMLPASRLLNSSYAGLIEPDQRATFTAQLAEVWRGARETFALEARHQPAGREPFWGKLTVAAVPASEGGIAYALLMLEDIDIRKTQELELAHRAAHDALTGLPNRALFRDRLDHAIRAARRSRGEVAVLMIDLDRFKPVNDELGHHAGDLLLQQLSRRMRGSLRDADTVARVGGDEFAVVLEHEGVAGAEAAARKLLDAGSRSFHIDGHERSVGLSIGIATFPADATSADALLRKADRAMYEAKRVQSGYHPGARSAAKPAGLKS